MATIPATGIGTDESASTSSWQLFYEGEVFDGNLLAQVGYSFEQNAGLAIGTAPPLLTANGYSSCCCLEAC